MDEIEAMFDYLEGCLDVNAKRYRKHFFNQEERELDIINNEILSRRTHVNFESIHPTKIDFSDYRMYELVKTCIDQIFVNNNDGLSTFEKLHEYLGSLNEIEQGSDTFIYTSNLSVPFNSSLEENELFIVKTTFLTSSNEIKQNILHEAAMGLKYFNKLKEWIPNFCYIFSYFECSAVKKFWCNRKDPMVPYVLMEKVDNGKKIYDIKYLTPDQKMSILQQIVLSFLTAYSKIPFIKHGDFHTKNLLIKFDDSIKEIYFPISDKIIKTPTFGVIVMIIDFGCSCFKDEHEYMPYSDDNINDMYGIDCQENELYDIHRILMYLYSDQKFSDIVSKLLPFFYIDCKPHIAERMSRERTGYYIYPNKKYCEKNMKKTFEKYAPTLRDFYDFMSEIIPISTSEVSFSPRNGRKLFVVRDSSFFDLYFLNFKIDFFDFKSAFNQTFDFYESLLNPMKDLTKCKKYIELKRQIFVLNKIRNHYLYQNSDIDNYQGFSDIFEDFSFLLNKLKEEQEYLKNIS